MKRILLLIIFGGLALRLVLLPLIQNPGLHDQNHYYNLGRRLLLGDGFTIDYVWHFNDVPAEIVNPVDHWMPLPAVAVWAGMLIAGENVHASLIFFIAAGLLIPLLSYWGAKQLGLSDTSALFAAAFAVIIPDLLSYSLRSDSSIFNALFISASCLLFNKGLQGSKWYFAASGLAGGLAYLCRNDAILLIPLVFAVLFIYWFWSSIEKRKLLWAGMLIPLVFALTIAPWLIRNQLVLGRIGTAEGNKMFFMTDARQHYAYNMPITLETMLAEQSIPELLYKRAFEFAAAVKQVFDSLSWLSPLFLLGLFYIWRERKQLWVLAPILLWLIGILIAYPIFIPMKSQSGSFEKAYLGILPLLLPIAALAIEKLRREWRLPLVLAAVALLLWQGIGYVRDDTDFANRYYQSITALVETLETMPDVTGDGEIRIMSQDPYVMSYFGYASIMTPLASREDVLALAAHFEIDYMLMPAARPALDALYLGEEEDPRFVFAAQIERHDGRFFELYALNGAEND
jgi:hypothetical protein